MKKGLLLLPLVGGMMLAGCDLSNLGSLDLMDLLDPLHLIHEKKEEEKKPDPDPQEQEVTVTLNKTTATLEEGQTLQLTATVTGSEEAKTWTVESGVGVVTVSESGLVTAVTAGSATVKVSVGKKSDTCSITVTAPEEEHHGDIKEGDTVVLDFSSSEFKENQYIPRIEDGTTLYTFEYNGITYNDMGSYANVYDETYWLMMKNKWSDGKVTSGENYAFIGNAMSYGVAIKSIDVEISSQTGGVDFYVAFGSSAFTEFKAGSVSGYEKHTATASTSSTFSVTNTGTTEFFGICAGKDVGQYRKNGGIAKLTIHF